MKRWGAAWGFIMATFTTVIVAAAVFFFLMPSHVPVRSTSGLTIMLGNSIPLRISAIIFVLNIFLLTLGSLFIGKELGLKAVYASFLLPVVLAVFKLISPDNQFIINNTFLGMLCYIFMVSIDLAMLFNQNASSGGLDIVVKFLNKYLHMGLGKAMSLAGICTVLSSALAHDKRIMVLSILETCLGGVALGHLVFGFNIRKHAYTVSEHEEGIREFILHHLHSNTIVYKAVGVYDKKPRREIITIVDRSGYSMLVTFVLEMSKDAFVTIYMINEIVYRPKY